MFICLTRNREIVKKKFPAYCSDVIIWSIWHNMVYSDNMVVTRFTDVAIQVRPLVWSKLKSSLLATEFDNLGKNI